MHSFKDEVVWITGASAGIGAALAHEFASRGAIVCISARRRERLEELASAISQSGGRAFAFPCDVTVESDIADTVAAIVAAHGKLDCAVANAGFGVSGRIESLSAEDWRRQFDVNVVGAGIRSVFRHRREHARADRPAVRLADCFGLH